MSAGRRARRTRLPACLADGRLRQAHLDTGMLTVAVAVGAGDIPSAATDDDDNQTCCAPDPAVRYGFGFALFIGDRRAEHDVLRVTTVKASWLRT